MRYTVEEGVAKARRAATQSDWVTSHAILDDLCTDAVRRFAATGDRDAQLIVELLDQADAEDWTFWCS